MMAVLSLEVVMRQRRMGAGETSRQPRMTVLPKMMSGSPESMHPLVVLETVTGLRLLVRINSVRLAISNHLPSIGTPAKWRCSRMLQEARGSSLYKSFPAFDI